MNSKNTLLNNFTDCRDYPAKAKFTFLYLEAEWNFLTDLPISSVRKDCQNKTNSRELVTRMLNA